MKLKLNPQAHEGPTTSVEVIDANTLTINGELYDIPPDLVDIDPVGPILGGSRDDDGTLRLTILYQYGTDDRAIWESTRLDGSYRGSDWEDWTGVVS